MSKAVYFQDYNPQKIRKELLETYRERFFRLFMSKIDISGNAVSSDGKFFAKRMLWRLGSFAISKSTIAKMEETIGEKSEEETAVITGYVSSEVNIYDQTIKGQLLNGKGSKLIQKGILEANKDFVICFSGSNCRLKPGSGIERTARRYINRMVIAGMAMYTNILLQKMPFVAKCPPEEENQAMNAVRQIVNDEIVVFMKSEMPLDVANFSVPYVVDKLSDYETKLQNEFLTEIGVDNSKTLSSGQDRLNMDEVNANNSMINSFARDLQNEFDDFNERVEKVLGIDFKISIHKEEVQSVHEEINEPDKEETGVEE